MKINKKLFLIAVMMIPFVVISFIYKDKTNFNLEKKKKQNKEITVRVKVDDEVKSLKLEDYVIGVVAAEMPASFNMEALKAQAVASRSYALYKKNTSSGEYDLTDGVGTQAYIDENKMKEKWGNEFNKYYNRVRDAVLYTEGLVMTYNNEVIEAFYFSMSSGMTQDSASVFKESTDYLKSTTSPYDNESINNYEVETEFGLDEFKSKLNINCEIKIDYINYNENGYVSNLSICNQVFDGNEFRNKLGLRSANFKIELNDSIKITTKGYGHGVGMSQYGANGFANAGYDFEDILKHYYQNIEITSIKNV